MNNIIILMHLIMLNLGISSEHNFVSLTGLHLLLNERAISHGDDVLITAIGEGDDALHCMTDQVDCCTRIYGRHRGEWRYPDRSLIPGGGAGQDFYRNRAFQQVLLHRRNDALGPLGMYCCEVDSREDPDAKLCINLGRLETPYSS